MLEFQIKNNIFGEWDDTKGLYKKITGDLIDKEGNLIDLSKVENPLEIIMETLNMTEEELNMKTKMLNNFSFSVEGRAYKELGKHYNAIYDIMANLSDFTNNPIKVTANQLNSLEEAIRMSSDVKYHDMTKLNGKRLKDDAITVGSKYAKENIKTSLEVVDMLRSGNYKVSDLREKISGMDVLGATALFRVLKENKDISSEELFKKSYKDVDKFISRGSFDKFYAYKNTTGIFDELSGIRNTGETHSYATKLRLSGVELQKLDVTNVMEKIGSFGSYDKTNPETLREMIRKQKYYTGASDIFYDNMIESAISAKHGLTLGGLEGSKLFIKSLLSKDSSLLNKKTIRLFDEIYIDNLEKSLLKFADTLLVFNEGYSKINKSLENVMDKVADSGLDKDIFLGSFEFDNEYYKKILKGNDVSKADIKKYLEYKDEYKSTMNTIEKNLFEEVKKIKNIDYLDFEMFKGIHLFGELMIQNEPNSEYDYSKIKDLLTSYRNNEIDFNELSNNYEFRKFKSQTYATLGTAAGISNVANLKEYADSFYKSYYTNNITNEFFNVISNKYDIDINNVASMFDKNLELKDSKEELFSSEDLEGISKLSARFKNQLDKRKVEFLTSLEKDSVTAYANILSKNITEFSNNGKAGEESLKIINNHLDNGMLSFNDSTYSYGIKELENAKNKRLSDISLFYSEYDDSFSELILGEGIESIDKNLHVGIISQAEKVVDEYMLKNVRENLRVVSVAETYSDEFVSILVNNKFHKLTDYDREMVSMGKAVVLNGYKESDFKELERVVSGRNNVKFQFSNNGFLFPGGIADQESIDAIVKMYEKNGNLYIGESVANTIIKRSDKYRSMFEDSLFDKKKLIEELKLANIHLKEEITLDNVSRRINTKFDSKLAARIKFSDYMNSNKDYFFELKKDKEQYKEFKRNFINNLENILSDFSKIDSRIKTTYIDDYYVNIANSLSQSNKKYKRMEEVLSSEDKIKSFKRLSSKLDNILKENRDWLDTEDIDSDLFKKISTIELLRQFGENEVDVNKVILNSASAMNGKEYNYKTFKTSKAFIKDIVSNPKVSVGALGVIAGATLIKSITGASEPLKMPNGNYILGKTNSELSNNEIAGDLANGMLNNNPLEIQELGRNLDIPEYISILKKMYF